MTTIPQLTRQRNKKRHLGRENLSGRLALCCSLLVSLFLLIAGIVVIYFYINLTRDLPSLEIFSLYLDLPDGEFLQPTILYDRSGKHELLRLSNPGATEAHYMHVDQFPNERKEYFSEALIRATIATIEPEFWTDEGTPLEWLFNEDANLLGQRLVSTTFLLDEPQGLLHDLRVRLLAYQVIEEYGQAKVLEWYLNSTRYGSYIYGADAAAHVYLGKASNELNLAEGTLLAAIAEAPDINPHTVPDLVLERQETLIKEFLERDLISAQDAKNALNEKFIFTEEINIQDDFQPFTGFVLEQLTSIFPKDRIERGGLKVITSMDYILQIQIQCSMDEVINQSEHHEVTTFAIDGSQCESARLLPTVFPGVEEFPEQLKATSAITDPSTGQLLAFAMVSNAGGNPGQISRFPAGTVLTPFIYLTAFSRGYNPSTMVWDIPERVDLSENDDSITDVDEWINISEPYHGPIRLRTALANDYLRPALNLMDQIGDRNINNTLSRFGIFSQLTFETSPDLKKRILEEEIGLLDIVRAYGILANQGMIAGQVVDEDSQGNDPNAVGISAVLRIEDTVGSILVDWSTPESKSIVSTQLAYLVSNILSDESSRWDSLGHPNPLEIGRTVAVKISHTLDNKGSWVVGYEPNKVVGVWLESTQDEQQSILPKINAGLWHAIVQYTLREEQIVSWQVPTGIRTIDVCDPSGFLPTSNCPHIVTETFLSGQEPTYYDNLYQLFQVNTETGNLATIFTPPELIEERVFLVVPSQVEEWAQSENYPLPPKNYDVFGVSINESPNVRIDSPLISSHIGGIVSIRGSASGDGFSYYRIQIGKGLNPQNWIQIGEDFTEPVNDNILVDWDTWGLNGLYIIQLMVVRSDLRVETANLQVTIDNQAPNISIQSPDDNQRVSAIDSDILILRAEVNDDFQVAKVDFYIDERLFTTLTLPPYIVPWESVIGEHVLEIKALDLAGNTSQHAIHFSVSK